MLLEMPWKQTVHASFLTALVCIHFQLLITFMGLIKTIYSLMNRCKVDKLKQSELITINKKWQTDNPLMQRGVCVCVSA